MLALRAWGPVPPLNRQSRLVPTYVWGALGEPVALVSWEPVLELAYLSMGT